MTLRQKVAPRVQSIGEGLARTFHVVAIVMFVMLLVEVAALGMFYVRAERADRLREAERVARGDAVVADVITRLEDLADLNRTNILAHHCRSEERLAELVDLVGGTPAPRPTDCPSVQPRP